MMVRLSKFLRKSQEQKGDVPDVVYVVVVVFTVVVAVFRFTVVAVVVVSVLIVVVDGSFVVVHFKPSKVAALYNDSVQKSS